MASSTRALETFLTGIAEKRAESSASPPEQAPAQVHHVIPLTILRQANGPVKLEELKQRSELTGDVFEQIIAGLRADELISVDDVSVSLTPKGQKAADEARSRLLSF